MTTRLATCSCGQLRVTCEGEPVRISICHCLECQKRTGSVFAAQARFARTDVTIAGDSAQWTRRGDEGGAATFHFCATCGATLYWLPQDVSDLIYVATGAFADPTFPPPTVSVYEERQHKWTANIGALAMEHHR
ncbi:MAG: GFA family protein [Hyphomonadaceae bacterium JAD_PAG50586_4]|nr:MAG: GFA family protein [Hyphomonadaceae bacterium JAD_PAG50586_4]